MANVGFYKSSSSTFLRPHIYGPSNAPASFEFPHVDAAVLKYSTITAPFSTHLSLLGKRRGCSIGGVRTSTYVNVRRRTSTYGVVRRRTATYVDVHRRRSTYIDVHRRTLTYVDVRRRKSTCVNVRRCMSTYVDVRRPNLLFFIFLCNHPCRTLLIVGCTIE